MKAQQDMRNTIFQPRQTLITADWLNAVDAAVFDPGPIKLTSYTVATLPSASTYAQCLIYVSNGTGNKRLAVSDGTNWRWPDGTIVS